MTNLPTSFYKKVFLVMGISLLFSQVFLILFITIHSRGIKKEEGKKVLAASTTNIKESFIPLGTGTIQSNEWTNVPGLLVAINTANYPNIAQALFEVAIINKNASGTIYVRLYNVTNQHPVWTSQVFADGISTYIVSSPLVFDSGNTVYQVQMMNTLNAPATLTQARIRIQSN